MQDLELDSLGLIEMTFAIEERFGVEFPDLKTSAEILLLPLPEGIRRIAAMPGGTTLFEFIELELARTRGAGEAGPDARERMLRDASVADLASAVGGPVPTALTAGTPLAELRVADLFRVVTVAIVARYVEFLRAQQAAR